MVALVCDVCKGSLTMDETGEFAVCDFCGVKYARERIQAKVQEIKGVVEVTKGEAEKERLLKNAQTFISLKKYDKAEKIYQEITQQYPNDYRGWYGLLLIHGKYTIEVAYYSYSDICEYANAVINLTDEEVILEAVLKLMRNYLIRISESNPSYYSEIITEKFDELGSLKPYFIELNEEFKSYEKARERFENLEQDTKYIVFKKLWKDSHRTPNIGDILNCDFVYKNQVGLSFETSYMYSATEDIINLEVPFNLIIDEAEAEMDMRIKKKLCQHCGSAFKGVFTKVCTKCGKPKDY